MATSSRLQSLEAAYNEFMIPPELSDILERNPEVVHGEVCFTRSRVPLKILLDYLEEGSSLADFLADFPTVEEEAAKQVLRYLAQQNRRILDLAS